MSVNSYDNQTKTLTSVAGGTRVWIGTDSAHTSAVSGGTMPNNCMVYITDDTSEQISTTPTQGSTLPISSGGVYNAFENRQISTTVVFLADSSTGTVSDSGNWTRDATYAQLYHKYFRKPTRAGYKFLFAMPVIRWTNSDVYVPLQIVEPSIVVADGAQLSILSSSDLTTGDLVIGGATCVWEKL